MITEPREYTVFADSQHDVSGTALSLTQMGFTPQQVNQARMMRVSVTIQAARYRLNGDAPTAAIGDPIAAATNITISGKSNLRNFKIIAQSSTATLFIQLLR